MLTGRFLSATPILIESTGGELREYTKTSRVRGFRAKWEEIAKAQGVDANSPEAKDMLRKLGGYMLIRGEPFIMDAGEIALICEAVRQADREHGVLNRTRRDCHSAQKAVEIQRPLVEAGKLLKQVWRPMRRAKP